MDFDKLASKYWGTVARSYEAKRRDGKWDAEQRAAADLLRNVPPRSKALDVPVGTGRLIPILASCALIITGLDASTDMLAEAEDCARRSGAKVELRQADIRNIPFAESSFEVVTCLRFLNWIDMKGVEQVLAELSRVSSDKLLLGVRYLTPAAEMKFSTRDLTLRAARFFGLPGLRIKRWGMVLHRREAVEDLFENLKISVLEKRLVERRADSTDYVFYFLEKSKI